MVFGLFSWFCSGTGHTSNPSSVPPSPSIFMRFITNIYALFLNIDSNTDAEKIEFLENESAAWKNRYFAAKEENEATLNTLCNYFVWHANRFSEVDIRAAALASDNALLFSQREELRNGFIELQKENNELQQRVESLSIALQNAGLRIHWLEGELGNALEANRSLGVAHFSLLNDFRKLQEENSGLKSIVRGELDIPPQVTPITSLDNSF